ncbi:hypothetical protein BZZ01_04485 [Nostocales cyanobacterium HT-58-2]|nr:hypothetical protein BZZ01_04485 [Nostocales cyanobacterium HT-58-2]
MQQLTLVYDSTSLSIHSIYQIEGYLYRFLYKDPYASIRHPAYVFSPLQGQRRKVNLILNSNKLKAKVVYKVEGMTLEPNMLVTNDAVQLSLW